MTKATFTLEFEKLDITGINELFTNNPALNFAMIYLSSYSKGNISLKPLKNLF